MESTEPISTGTLASVLALIVCIGGAYEVYTYSVNAGAIYGISIATYPYRAYVGAFVLGAVVSLGGLLYSVIVSSKKPEIHEKPSLTRNVQVGVSSSQILCGTCGTMNDMDTVYCKKCGRQFR